ncbi:MAG: ShlB/FhaC/HecB family hemolysin secretion/activation protein [Pseudomonadota bacterium]
MIKNVRTLGKFFSLLLFVVITISTNYAIALPLAPAQLLPSSVLPERQSKDLSPQAPQSNTLPPLPKAKPQAAQNALGPAATKIKFKISTVNLKGNTVYSTAELSKLYKSKLGSVITVAELQDIVQSITNYYRNDGYVLSRAILPPQHVANGVVNIQIVEGYIDHVKVIGAPHGARPLIQRFGDQILLQRPLQIKRMEHYLLLANTIPGVQVKAVLEPSKTNIGASTLDLVTQTKTFSGYLSYDNYGTRYIGPNEVTTGGEVESIFLPGDSTSMTISRTTRPQELKFFLVGYNMAVGVQGARLSFSMNQARTLPGFVLAPLKINGDAFTFSTMLNYPLVKTRSQDLNLDATFNYIDSKVTTLQQAFMLYDDHIRSFRIGVNWDLSDTWYGSNNAGAHIEQGLDIFGATPISKSETGFTSRYGASGHFTKLELMYSRLQQLGATRYSVFFIAKTQWSCEPLLATEQFGFGGVQQALGRGYDSAEIIGDRGLAGSIELRMNVMPGRVLLQAAQLYMFYDAGVIWNARQVVDQLQKQSATSAGVGSRFFFTQNVTGNLVWAQPLTRQVDALALLGDGRQPRVFFSVTATV